MPRTSRIISSTGIYHIILRSVNKHIIFEEEADYQKFLFILSDYQKTYDVDILAYCLMDNHIHIMIKSDDDYLSKFLQSFCSTFARWYNSKYERYGHLFQERFFSRPVEDINYYLNTLIYIHNNPVEAGSCRFPSEYQWSSFNAFYGSKNNLVNLNFSIELIGSLKNIQNFFAVYSSNPDYVLDPSEYDYIPAKFLLTDEQALDIYKQLTGFDNTYDIIEIRKVERNRIIRDLIDNGLSQSQISRLTGLSVPTIHRISKAK